MHVPEPMSLAFKADFEPVLIDFLLSQQMIPERDSLKSKRYLTRSIAPHVSTLSQLFNRIEPTAEGVDQESYFQEGSNPVNRRLAYFLSFMPCNLFRVASVWSELKRLGFEWPAMEDFRALEFGAGTASGACGILAGEQFAPLGLPNRGSFALIEQSKAALQLGAAWFQSYQKHALPDSQIEARTFHRRIDLSGAWLPRNAPKFHLMVSSFFLNESELEPTTIARTLFETIDRHMENEGLFIIVEPALKLQSRKLLEIRKALIALSAKNPSVPFSIRLPCLGSQACGALSQADDWCHEEVSWWRPSYLRDLDQLVHLDRKTLPFSYLVLHKSKRPIEEVLPKISGLNRYRLVSPARTRGQTQEFYICGEDGKRRARFRGADPELGRGDILLNVEHHGDPALTQIDQASRVDDPS